MLCLVLCSIMLGLQHKCSTLKLSALSSGVDSSAKACMARKSGCSSGLSGMLSQNIAGSSAFSSITAFSGVISSSLSDDVMSGQLLTKRANGSSQVQQLKQRSHTAAAHSSRRKRPLIPGTMGQTTPSDNEQGIETRHSDSRASVLASSRQCKFQVDGASRDYSSAAARSRLPLLRVATSNQEQLIQLRICRIDAHRCSVQYGGALPSSSPVQPLAGLAIAHAILNGHLDPVDLCSCAARTTLRSFRKLFSAEQQHN